MHFYEAHLRATIRARSQRLIFLGGPLSVGLLTKPCQPEGEGHIELSGERGYKRQPLLLNGNEIKNSHGRLFSTNIVKFETITEEDPEITHVAVFDEAGKVLFHGMLDGDGRRRPTEAIEFRQGKIQLKWS